VCEVSCGTRWGLLGLGVAIAAVHYFRQHRPGLDRERREYRVIVAVPPLTFAVSVVTEFAFGLVRRSTPAEVISRRHSLAGTPVRRIPHDRITCVARWSSPSWRRRSCC